MQPSPKGLSASLTWYGDVDTYVPLQRGTGQEGDMGWYIGGHSGQGEGDTADRQPPLHIWSVFFFIIIESYIVERIYIPRKMITWEC